MDQPWKNPEMITHCAALAASFRKLAGHYLVLSTGDHAQDAYALFHAPFALLSHGTEADPVLNYGNRTALDLWEMDFATFTQMPSRLTAEPVAREERQRLMEEAARKGFIDNYAGIRISASGRRFRISNVILWTVTDAGGRHLGQAAFFDRWDHI